MSVGGIGEGQAWLRGTTIPGRGHHGGSEGLVRARPRERACPISGSWDCYSHFADGKTEPQGALVLDLPLSDSKVCALPTEACGGGESLVITSDVGQPRLQKQVISAFGFPSSLRF